MKGNRIHWGVIGFLFELCALTVWIGGLVVIIGVIIPAVFNTVGMEPAGRVLRRIFDGYLQVNGGILILLGIILVFRVKAYGSHSAELFSVSSNEWWLLAGMGLVTFSILGVFGPQTVALQEQAFEAVSKEEKNLAYEQFFRLHMIVRALHLVNLGLAIALFTIKVRKPLIGRLGTVYPSSDSEREKTMTRREPE